MEAVAECKKTLEIEIPVGEVEREYNRVVRQIQQQARVPGFRPGHAPLSIIQRRFTETIRQEVLEALLPAHLQAGLRRDNLDPVSQPVVEDLRYEAGQPIRFKASFEVAPEIALRDYADIQVELTHASVSEEDVEREMKELIQSRATVADVEDAEAAAAPGMVAVVASENQVFGAEGEEPVTHSSQETWIRIGDDDTLPEFTQALTGAKVGERREVDIAYPSDYGSAEYAGKRAHYKLEVKRLMRREVPAWTDALASEISKEDAKTVDELRQKIREQMLHKRERDAQHEAEDKLIDELLARHSFPAPASMVESQAKKNVRGVIRSLASQGIDPRKLDWNWSEIRPAQRQRAEREVRTALLLDRIAEAEQITVGEADVEQEISLLAQRTHQSVEALRPRLMEPETLEQMKTSLRRTKTMDRLFHRATGSTRSDDTIEATA